MATLPCVNCQTQNDALARFCSACGIPLAGTSEQDARSSLEARLRTDATPAGRLVHAAFVRLSENDYEDALMGLRAALDMAPDLWSAHLLQGVILAQQGEGEKAEEHLHTALQSEPDAVYHKATLERIMASHLPANRGLHLPKWLGGGLGGQRAPLTLALLSMGLVLVIGLAVAIVASTPPRKTRVRQPASFQSPPGLQPVQPTPSPYVPAQPPVPVSVLPSDSRLSGRASLPPAEDAPDGSPLVSNPTAPLARATAGIPPAVPDIGQVPELIVKRRPDAPRLPSLESVESPAPPQTADNDHQSRQAPIRQSPTMPPGRAYVGYEPIPAPPPQNQTAPPAAKTNTPAANVTVQEAAAPKEIQPGGEELQRTAMQLQRQRRFSEAADYYQRAIDAYQRQIAAGRSIEAARRGMASCQAGLTLAQAQM